MSTYRPSWDLSDETTEPPVVNGDDPAVNGEAAARNGESQIDDDGNSWCYASVDEWVAGWLLPTWRRDPHAGGRRWCASWRDHPEAVLRLELAWKTWESAHHDSHAYTAWLLHTWDPIWSALTAPDGPFTACTPSRHDAPPQLPETA